MLAGIGRDGTVAARAEKGSADAAKPSSGKAAEKPRREINSSLARFVRDIYDRASDHKISQGIEKRFLRALKARNGERDEVSKQMLRDVGMDEDLSSQITDVKCNSAKAQLDEVYVNGPNDEFTMEPTPLPDLPDEDSIRIFGEMMKAVMLYVVTTGQPPTAESIQAEAQRRYDEMMNAEMKLAKERVGRMEKLMRDQLEEGGFRDAKAGYINDVVTYGTGIIEGPVDAVEMRMVPKRTKLGAAVYESEAVKITKLRSVSPWDVFPAPECKKVGDSPLCIKVRYSGSDLYGFVQTADSGGVVDGWDVDAVKRLLDEHEKGWKETSVGSDMERRRLEGNGGEGVFCGDGWMYEGLKVYAVMRGSVLIREGAPSKEPIDKSKFYMIETVTIADKLVFCRLKKNARIPVSKGVFYDKPGSFWGRSIADRCVPAQNVQDSCLYWLKMNMGMSSMPMFYTRDFQSLLDKGPGALDVKAGKFWALRGSGLGAAGGPPIGTIDVASHVSEILAALDRAKVMADDDTGIPAYSYGGASSASGVARTASGLKMLTEAAMRGMKMVIGQTDKDVIENILTMLYEKNLAESGDESVKGDAQIMVRGVMGRVLREQEKETQLQFLTMVSTNINLFQLVGPKAVAVILRKVSEGMGIPDFMPSDIQLEDLELINKIRQLAGAQSDMQAAQQQGMLPSGAGGGGGQGMPQAMPDAAGNTMPQGRVAERASAA